MTIYVEPVVKEPELYRLPAEPPEGTVVRPEPDNGERFTREGDTWTAGIIPLPGDMAVRRRSTWAGLLNDHRGGLVVVPGHHPAPWSVDPAGMNFVTIKDVTGKSVCDVSGPRYAETAQRIVDAINQEAR